MLKSSGDDRTYRPYLYSGSGIYTTHSLKALRIGPHSFTSKLHHACL